TVNISANTAKAITAFNFADLSVTGVINESAKTVTLTVPFGTDVTGLVPSITHTGSSISPNSGVAQNFTSPVTYTVTAANSSTQAYVVTVNISANTAKAITAFNFADLSVTGVINESAKTVTLTVPFGTDVTGLVPSITHTGSSISPNSGAAQNFTSPVTYTVTAANSSTQAYVVTVNISANTAKAITAFNFADLSVTGVINESAKTVTLTVPFGTDVSGLVPSITHTGSSISPNSGVAQNFTSPVTYTVTAANSSTQAYVVTVNISANTAKAITAFDFSSLSVTGIINESAKTVTLTVPFGTDVTGLVPSITHTGSSISPNTGAAQNFTSPVTYTVTAADSSTQDYVVTVTVLANTAKAITAFNFADISVTGVVNESAKTIALTVPYGTNVTALVPSITHTGSSVSPNTGVARNFTNPVTYTVTAADETTQDYVVTVTVADGTSKTITAFNFITPSVTGVIDEGAKTIALTVPYGTNVTALVASITHTGSSVSPDTGVAQDFTNPVTYMVTAPNSSTQAYLVTVTVSANPAKAVTAFNFTSPSVTGVINEGAKTIALTVPYGTNVTALVPSITHTGSSISPNTGVAQNFTNPVTYTVTAADTTTQNYVVTVTVSANPAKAITAFNFSSPSVTGVINEGAKTIALTVPYGTNVTALVPSITHTGSSISPNTGVARNFTNPVTYTVTAADSTTQAYVVTVTAADNSAKAISAFNFTSPAATGVINEEAKTIALTVPFGTDVTGLVPTITHSGSSVSPNTGVAQNFTSPVTYTVTAGDSSTQAYVVTVTVADNSAKAITAFNFASPATTGVVNEEAKTIALTVPYGTDVTGLVPTITHTGSSISPNTGVAQNYTNPVTYTVTAADSTTQSYIVTVTVSGNPAKAITAFNFTSPSVTGVINEGAKTISLTVAYGTDVTALVPSITHTGSSISPNTGVAQSFTNPVTYTVTAGDSTTQNYVVTVTVNSNTSKAITAFNFTNPAATGTINESAKTISLTVPAGTNVTALVPTITHTGSGISPDTGVAQNFLSPVTYTVTAGDSSTQEYVVTVTLNSNTSKAITAFNFSNPSVTGVINESAKTISLTVPFGTDVSALVPTITHSGSSISPNTGVSQDFTSPVTYTVTAGDSSTQAYVVTVTVTANDAKAITAFNFNNPSVTGVVNESAKTVSLNVPSGTDVSALVPSITHTGSSISPNTGVAQNFTNPVTYTVTAADSTTQAYVVTVSVNSTSAKSITAFNFTSPSATGVIDEGAKTISLTVPNGTNLSSIVPSITHTGSSISPNTGVAQNFFTPVTYTVTAGDSTTQEYLVTVTMGSNSEKAITAFNFSTPSVTGVINESAKTVTLTVPYGTDVTALVPNIMQSGSSISPNSGVAQDFTNPVTYTVTANDSTTQAYVVTVVVASGSAKAITAFNIMIPSVTGVINESAKTITLTVPSGTNVSMLVPNITHTGSSVSPNTGIGQDFTNPVTYTVTAGDSTTQGYVVTVIIQ
ncbi:MAG: DUF5018 domain-containing protein, partial [Candidatus Riflebacteria bacterium]|nr:DUF5018 domain-containing protein [Candidatus Riflebacteria bacterium]